MIVGKKSKREQVQTYGPGLTRAVAESKHFSIGDFQWWLKDKENMMPQTENTQYTNG